MTDQQDSFLRLPAVLQRTSLTRSTLYRKIQQGSFPRQIKISERCAGWRQSDINDWLHNPRFYEQSRE
jgi:prophage regulatory protein